MFTCKRAEIKKKILINACKEGKLQTIGSPHLLRVKQNKMQYYDTIFCFITGQNSIAYMLKFTEKRIYFDILSQESTQIYYRYNSMTIKRFFFSLNTLNTWTLLMKLKHILNANYILNFTDLDQRFMNWGHFLPVMGLQLEVLSLLSVNKITIIRLKVHM